MWMENLNLTFINFSVYIHDHDIQGKSSKELQAYQGVDVESVLHSWSSFSYMHLIFISILLLVVVVLELLMSLQG